MYFAFSPPTATQYSVSYFVGQYFCIVVAPVFYSSALFAILSMLIQRVGHAFSTLPPKLVLWLFVTCDIIATLIQVTGASLIGSAYTNGKDPKTSNHILLAGLIFQVVSFAIFVWCYIVFVVRARKALTPARKVFISTTFVAALAVHLRTAIRLAETAEGLLRLLSGREVTFGCLVFAPILVAVYLLAAFHPGMYWGKAQGQQEGSKKGALKKRGRRRDCEWLE